MRRTGWFLAWSTLCSACAPTAEEIQADFEAFLAEHRACQQADECALVSPGCPLGCYAAVSKDAAEAAERRAAGLISDYERGGQACAYSCVEPPTLVCRDMRCETGDPVPPNNGEEQTSEDDCDGGRDCPGEVAHPPALDAGGTGLPPIDDWVVLETGCPFSFQAPEGDLRAQEVQGIDSCVALFVSDHCRLNADYGLFSDPLTGLEDKPEYTAEQVTIAGQEATIVTYSDAASAQPYIAAVHFPQVPTSPNPLGDLRLTMSLACDGRTFRDQLQQVFHTIRFE